MKRLYTGGTFDLFHAGHVNFLRQCSKLADKVIVSLNTDEFIEEYKGFRPTYSYDDRYAILNSCKYVDAVIENRGGANSKLAIGDIRPDIIAIGTDWAAKDYYKQMGFTQTWLDLQGITLVYLPYTPHISSTKIRQELAK